MEAKPRRLAAVVHGLQGKMDTLVSKSKEVQGGATLTMPKPRRKSAERPQEGMRWADAERRMSFAIADEIERHSDYEDQKEVPLSVLMATLVAAGKFARFLDESGRILDMDLLESWAIRYLSAAMRDEPEPGTEGNA
jgi:hypothetical protein